MRWKKLARFKRAIRARTTDVRIIGVVVVCVVAAGLLLAAWRSTHFAHITSVEAQTIAPPAPKLAVSRAQTTTTGASKTPAAATIAGCLERDHDTFRLKNTAGADAPKSRSWKSAFLKKGSASIEVVDTANRLKLPNHVGERVSVTGMLVDREMQVRSLQRVAGSCD